MAELVRGSMLLLLFLPAVVTSVIMGYKACRAGFRNDSQVACFVVLIAASILLGVGVLNQFPKGIEAAYHRFPPEYHGLR